MNADGAQEAPEEAGFRGGGGRRSGTWLVLGGGGLKGLAHIGAWQVLQEAGVPLDGIAGTSIGALVGALASSGVPVEAMRARGLSLERADIARVNRRAIWMNGIRQPSIFRGDALRALYAEILPPEGWDALRIPLLINAVDLGDGSTAWFGPGARTDLSLVDAVYASSALPVFYPPHESDGHAYVDGGILGQLAVGRAADAGAERIIAVDVGSSGDADVSEILDGGMIGVHQRVISIMMSARRHDVVSGWQGPPLLYVRPRLAGYGTFDFEHIPYFIEEGYRAMKEALAAS